MPDMTVQEFLALVQKYDALRSKYDARDIRSPSALFLAHYEELQSVGKQIEACGFDLGFDKKGRVRLYLAGKSPKSARPHSPDE